MQIEISTEDDVLLVTARGRITYDQLLIEADPILQVAGPDVYTRKVLLNLSDLDYIDTSGISWLLACHKRTREAKGLLVLHSIPPLVLQTLKVLRLDQVFVVAEDLFTARQLAACERSRPSDKPAVRGIA